MDNHQVFHIASRGAFFFCATIFLPMRPRRCAWILVAWMKIWNGELRINIQLYPVHVCKIKHPYVDGLCSLCHPFVVNWGWWTILLYSHCVHTLCLSHMDPAVPSVEVFGVWYGRCSVPSLEVFGCIGHIGTFTHSKPGKQIEKDGTGQLYHELLVGL